VRFYIKLILMVGPFVGFSSTTGRRMAGNLAYEARVLFVTTFGSEADHERLIEYTGRRMAIERGCLDEYLARERFGQLRLICVQSNDGDTATPEEDPFDGGGSRGVNSTASLDAASGLSRPTVYARLRLPV